MMPEALTMILVIETYGFAVCERNESSRTRDLPEAACLQLVQEVKGPRTDAYCYRTGEPDPGSGWVRRPPTVREPICAHGGGSCAWPLLPGRRRV